MKTLKKLLLLITMVVVMSMGTVVSFAGAVNETAVSEVANAETADGMSEEVKYIMIGIILLVIVVVVVVVCSTLVSALPIIEILD